MEPDLTGTAELAYRAEIRRKLLHLFAFSMPIGYHLVDQTTAVVTVFIAFTVSLLVDISRFKGWGPRSWWRRCTDPIVRPREAASFTGATHILLSGWLCPLFLSLPAAALGMATIILGDIAAALIGRRWGRNRYAGNRSYEGSAAFLAAALIAGLLLPGVPVWLGVAAALLATVVEGLSRSIDDNLSVPIVVGLFVHLTLRVI